MVPSYFMRRLLRMFRQPEVRFPVNLILILFGAIVVFASVFSYFEKGASFQDGLWTAYITLTTIGYGDFFAKTWEGRLATVLTSMFGIGCFAVFTGIILERAMQRRFQKMKGERSFSGGGHIVLVNVH
ncbi:MAG: potassium channel family protein, partial [Nitrospinales bacterium]